MNVMRKVSPPLVVASLLALALVLPAAAQASPSATMTVSSSLFPSGAAAPDGVTGKVHVVAGSSVTLTAPRYLYEPGTASASPSVDEFIFWDVNATLQRKVKARFTAPSTGFSATAWYLPIGGGCAAGQTCVGDVTTWAFSLASNRPLSFTPISSVTPAAAWTLGSSSVSTTDAAVLAAGHVQVTAASRLSFSGTPVPVPKFGGYYAFSSWFQFAGDGKVSGVFLTVPKNGASDSIAFYATVPPIPPPPHCGGLGEPPCHPM
jgi:hypothetical protein